MSNSQEVVNQPDEINALRTLVKEFVSRIQNVDNEIESLKEAKKEIIEEYKDKLDMKVLKAALRICNIRATVFESKDTLDLFLETLTDPTL